MSSVGELVLGSVRARTGTAPISWGVCEVPGWGVQLEPDRVLAEMAELGFTATELGSVGFLPTDPVALRETLDSFGLRLTGGFVALALHDTARVETVIAEATDAALLLAGAGAENFVTCAVSDPSDWDRFELEPSQWQQMFTMLDRVDEICAEHGLVQVFHPHVDSLVETSAEMQRVIDNSPVNWVLETGHMTIGGLDPVGFARSYRDRVGLVHLKDLDLGVARQLNNAELGLMDAVQQGLFPVLGQGDVDIAGVVKELETNGYQGWYVVEQDVAITGPVPAPGDGPILDVRASIEFIEAVDFRLAAEKTTQEGTNL